MFLLSIFNYKDWLIETEYFNRHSAVVFAILEGRFANSFKAFDDRKTIQDDVRYFAASPAKGGGPGSNKSVAVIPLKGVMTKDGGLCSFGTSDVAQAIQEAYDNPNVDAVVLHTDSPGGSVDGTERLANVLAKKTKPVVAFVDGLAASAAYWVASQASEIVISSKTTAWVGSIGTYATHINQAKALEMAGYKVTYIAADQSTDKLKGNSLEELTAETIASFKKDLNQINSTFISAVKAGRSDKLQNGEDIFTGKTFNGKEAQSLGMVDRIGNLEDAVKRAAYLSSRTNSSPNTNNSNAMKFPNLAKMLGWDKNTSADMEVTEIQMQQADEKIAAMESENDKLKSEIKTLTEAKAASELENEKLTAQVTGLKDALAAKETDLNASKEVQKKQAEEITTLKEWKANAKPFLTKSEDELNTTPVAKETPWEKEARETKEKFSKKKSA